MSEQKIEPGKEYTIRLTEIRKLEDRMLLLGPPGIGKTEVVAELAAKEAKDLGREFVDLRRADNNTLKNVYDNPGKYYVFYRLIATHVFPEDVSFPILGKKESYVRLLPPFILAIFGRENIRGVLFIDEITNVQREDQQTLFFGLIQEKEAGWALKMSDGIKIVLAGNRSDWSELATPLSEPLRARMSLINVLEPEVKDWINYMQTKYTDRNGNACWDISTGVYLNFYQSDLLSMPEDEWENFPTPRNWTDVAWFLCGRKDPNTDDCSSPCRYNVDDPFIKAYVVGRLGRRVGGKFLVIVGKKRELLERIDEIASNPEIIDSMPLEDRVALLMALADMDPERLSRYKSILSHLAKKKEFRSFFDIFVRYLLKSKNMYGIVQLKSADPEIEMIIRDVIEESIRGEGWEVEEEEKPANEGLKLLVSYERRLAERKAERKRRLRR